MTDRQTGNPVAGATVNGASSDAKAQVSVRVIFTQVGTREVKATKPDTIRSNQITVHVFPCFFGEKKFADEKLLIISNFR